MTNREEITDGAIERAIDEPNAGKAPGIPDDALLPSEELPEEPSDEEVDQRIEIAEIAGPITPPHLEGVSDAIVARVESLHHEMKEEEIERVLTALVEDFDTRFSCDRRMAANPV